MKLSWEYAKQIDLKVKALKGPHALHSAENKEKDWSFKFHQLNINSLFLVLQFGNFLVFDAPKTPI